MYMLKAFLREPLFQFLFIGIALFAVDQYVLSNMENPRLIVVDDAKRAELAKIFREGQGNAPTEKELDDLTVAWTQNEILFREARQMGLQKGDDMIRQRLILKMRNILFNNVTAESPDEETLKTWFEENRSLYDKPELYDFEQFPVTDDENGISAESRAEKLAAEFGTNAQMEEYDGLIRRYQRRPGMNLTSVFGDEYGQKLIDSPDNNWVAVMSDQGWHVARITQRYAGQPVEFGTVRTKVATDYRTTMARLELSRAVKEIADQYELKLEFSKQPSAADAEEFSPIQQAKLHAGAK